MGVLRTKTSLIHWSYMVFGYKSPHNRKEFYETHKRFICTYNSMFP